jgi:hypothetical protein
VQEKRDALHVCHEELARLTCKVAEKTDSASSLQSKISHMQEHYAIILKDLEEQIEKTQTERNDLREKLVDASKERIDLQTRLVVLEEDYENLKVSFFFCRSSLLW